ncbi:hypothetical protein EQW78_12215 [Oerskovia turbata]|uniref:Uncharacterized protein n=1 Tax=Oerskovia turbata TaxID=1713 RepID=A0A4Q1KSU1_9CELL|nr:hypothetical protein [Oerskovia turbata]RXR25669.1 hypothetical protein EQW73_09130 [Oerskovia turbata]RXR33243.1 hypothetical protein EQW78_12215 [Oerskovia turbata]
MGSAPDPVPVSRVSGGAGGRSVAALAGVLVLGGCSSAPEPAPFSTEVEWPEGEPVGELEESPWVQAVRDYELVGAAATNALDFSSPHVDIMTESLARGWYSEVVDGIENGDLELRAGPMSFVVTSVEETESGATVIVCSGEGERIMTEPSRTASHVFTYEIEVLDEVPVVVWSEEGLWRSCDATGAVQGVFATPPDRALLTIDDPSVVVPPCG